MDPRSDIVAVMETEKGRIRVKFFWKRVPFTVANFVNLSRRGFYDGLVFHRVLKDRLIQGGCPYGTGEGGPGYTFGDEFVPELRHDRPGILSMANTGPCTNGSQFLITLEAAPQLDDRHTIFGVVVGKPDLMVVKRIVAGDRILRMSVEGDRSELTHLIWPQLTNWNDRLDEAFPNLGARRCPRKGRKAAAVAPEHGIRSARVFNSGRTSVPFGRG